MTGADFRGLGTRGVIFAFPLLGGVVRPGVGLARGVPPAAGETPLAFAPADGVAAWPFPAVSDFAEVSCPFALPWALPSPLPLPLPSLLLLPLPLALPL